MAFPTPANLLGIPKFDKWYPGQQSLMSQAMDWYNSPARFLGESIPTGAGKSVSALLLHQLSGTRTVILTASKGLMQQYACDAAFLGGVEVKGQNNFPCLLVPGLTADAGPCHDGMACVIKDSCPYQIQLKAAQEAPLVITNYAYWLAQNNFSKGFGDVGLIICDEVHQAFSCMESYLTVRLPRMDVEAAGAQFPESTSQWGTWHCWADMSLDIIRENLSRIEAEIKLFTSQNGHVPSHLSRSFRNAKSVLAKVERLSSVEEDWIIQKTYHGYSFTPQWVANYSNHLFGKVPKVLLMSAILSHRTADYLGVPSGDDRSWIEMDSYFPSMNTQIWHLPTARMNHGTDGFGTTIWSSRIDQIIQRRLDRKGIVFTVSYDRARMLIRSSRFKDIMWSHSTKDVVQVVDKFKLAASPAVLASPTVTTGWDFPGNGKPQYIIVGKIPYPDTQDAVTKARHKDDKDWTSYLAMEIIVQETGRCSRSSEDVTEVFIIDDNWLWFYPKYR